MVVGVGHDLRRRDAVVEPLLGRTQGQFPQEGFPSRDVESIHCHLLTFSDTSSKY